MAQYIYQALSKDGKQTSGTLDANTQDAARQQLSRQGLFVVSILPAASAKQQTLLQRIFARRITTKEKVLFTKQLAILLRSGVPLLQAFELLTEQFEGRMQTILVAIKDDLKEGMALATSLEQYPRVFDTIYVQLVRAGEASGNLERILERLTQFIERREELAKKIKGALRQPIIQLTVAILVVGFMMVKIVPNMVKNFASMGQDKLPTSTAILIGISDFLVNNFLLIIGALIALITAYNYWTSTPKGAYTVDSIKLRLPLVKYLTKTNVVVQFAYTLGMLLEGGVNLAQALDIVCATVNNRVLAEALREARENIIKEGKIAQYLKATNVFPPIAIYLIQTGEESGNLDEMLLTVAKNYEKEADELTDNLTAALNPIMLIVMAGLVGFIVISMVQLMQPPGDAF